MYSLSKATMNANHYQNISKYFKLIAFLKRKNAIQAEKCQHFEFWENNRFLVYFDNRCVPINIRILLVLFRSLFQMPPGAATKCNFDLLTFKLMLNRVNLVTDIFYNFFLPQNPKLISMNQERHHSFFEFLQSDSVAKLFKHFYKFFHIRCPIFSTICSILQVFCKLFFRRQLNFP